MGGTKKRTLAAGNTMGISFCFLLFLLYCVFFINVTAEAAGTKTAALTGNAAGLEVHFINVGQGDSTLIKCDGEAMLIDAGDMSKGSAVRRYLRKNKVKKLKYVLATHPDDDHIGGMQVVLRKFSIGTFIMPKYAVDTEAYKKLMDAAKERHVRITSPVSGKTFALGGAKFQIVSVNRWFGGKPNNWSIAIRLKYKRRSFLLVGDIQRAAQNAILKTGYTLKSDVYKVAHHGSYTGTSPAFMSAVHPKYAVISCGKNNDFGHPTGVVLDQLRGLGIPTFRTDLQGHIVVLSDGKRLTWNTQPETSWECGAAVSSVRKEYVVNNRTKVFHLPECKYAKTDSANTSAQTVSGRFLYKKGFKACRICLHG